MSNISITYNGHDPFVNLPTPFISLSQDFIDFGNHWDQITNLTLNGQIIETTNLSEQNYFDSLNSKMLALIDIFSKNYKTLNISAEGNQLIQGLAVVNSISFEESNWFGALPYSINFSIYEPSLFSENYGVVEPSEEISFTEEDGDIVTLTHSVSAKGIFPNAIQKAKEWVLSKNTNPQDKIKPILVKDIESKSYILQSIEEKIDRFNGTYSWIGNYKKSINNESPDNAFLNYTVDLNYSIEDGLVSTTINGSLEGDLIENLRTEFENLNLFNICSNFASETFDTPIFEDPISTSIVENPGENNLTFSYTFNNDFSPQVIINVTTDVVTDNLACTTNVSVNARIFCKNGDIATRWEKVKEFYESNFDVFSIANSAYSEEIDGNNSLQPNPVTESIKYDEFNAVIEHSAQYTDKRISTSNNILNMSSNVTLTPAIKIYVPNTSAFEARNHNIQNLNTANRTKINISVSVTAKLNQNISDAENVANSELNRIKNNYNVRNFIIESQETIKNEDIKTVTINQTLSFEGTVIT
jgi:hypothetical protein